MSTKHMSMCEVIFLRDNYFNVILIR